MSKIISFSVWGDDPLYLNGSLENIQLAKEIYPGWITRFYCEAATPEDFREDLVKAGAEVVVISKISSFWEGLFWRFYPASEKDVDVFISRDIDSRLNVREREAVNEWLRSDKMLHCMRDHIEHNVPILGGMWGCKKGLIENISDDIKKWGAYDYKGSDQDFLRKIIWERYREDSIVHDRYNNGIIITQKIKKTKEEILFMQQEITNYNEALKKLKDATQIEDSKRKPLNVTENNEIIEEYIYDPISFFGQHDIRPFPEHEAMIYGTYVGEIIKQ